jgi:hypothetical protein
MGSAQQQKKRAEAGQSYPKKFGVDGLQSISCAYPTLMAGACPYVASDVCEQNLCARLGFDEKSETRHMGRLACWAQRAQKREASLIRRHHRLGRPPPRSAATCSHHLNRPKLPPSSASVDASVVNQPLLHQRASGLLRRCYSG